MRQGRGEEKNVSNFQVEIRGRLREKVGGEKRRQFTLLSESTSSCSLFPLRNVLTLFIAFFFAPVTLFSRSGSRFFFFFFFFLFSSFVPCILLTN